VPAAGAARRGAAVDELKSHAERATRATLRQLRDGTFRASAFLDGKGSPEIRVACAKRGPRLSVDFSGTSKEIEGPYNANPAITLSAVFYVMRLLVSDDLPTNSGCLRPVSVKIPRGSLLRPNRPAAVAMGNVETSQRIVDVLMTALAPCARDRMPACSQGTMNNLTVGGRLADGRPFTFYETLGGGAGGGPMGPGAAGIQTHMTNTRNTPVEALEAAFPVLVTRYHLRRGSGGKGAHPGGDGLVRELTARTRTRVTVTATRRREGAPGLWGGGPGLAARDRIRTGGRWRSMPASGSVTLEAGDLIRIETPGGGGFGRPRG
jgi:N-methylhydantoinase B